MKKHRSARSVSVLGLLIASTLLLATLLGACNATPIQLPFGDGAAQRDAGGRDAPAQLDIGGGDAPGPVFDARSDGLAGDGGGDARPDGADGGGDAGDAGADGADAGSDGRSDGGTDRGDGGAGSDAIGEAGSG